MDAVFHAISVFVDRLEAIRWSAAGIAICFHLLKVVVTTRAWRNIVAAAYPNVRVRWRSIAGAYVAGTGVNAVVPVRGGDAVKLYIAKHRVEGATYPTLAATVLLQTLFDLAVAGALVLWALSEGALPSFDVLSRLPSLDVGWILRNPRLAAILGGVLALVVVIASLWARKRVADLRARVAQGFAALRRPRTYLRRVALLQAVEWCLRLTTIYWLLQAFGIPATLHVVLLVQVAQSLATVFPFSPAGIGTTEALLLYLLRDVAGGGTLLGFSVGMRLTLVVVNAAVGFGAILLMLRTLRWRDALAVPDSRPGRRV